LIAIRAQLTLIFVLHFISQSKSPPALADIVEQVNPAVVNIQVENQTNKDEGLGTGFIIDGRGLIVTNYHVIADAVKKSGRISIVLPDSRIVAPSVRGSDEATDIALLEVEVKGPPLPQIKLGDSDKLRIGDWVVAVGSPFGLDHTVTVGIISGKSRRGLGGQFNDYLQTDAAINPGNSGGPLVNMSGEVVGINTFIASVGQGLGFAIPINVLKDILPQLKDTGRVKRGSFAVEVAETTPYLRKLFDLQGNAGVLVTSVKTGTSAARSRIHRGDIILKLNDTEIESASQFNRLIAAQSPGKQVKLVILREGKQYTIEAEIE
jgi:serine protease Do